jgi:hypothetical protein
MSDAPRFRTRAIPPLPRRLVLVASEKGGVGKSVFTRTLIDFLRSNGSRIAAYDADGGIGATLRVLGLRDATGDLVDDQCAIEGVGYYQGRVEGERNMVLDCMASREALCVHDLAGGLLGDLTRIIDEGASLDGFMAAIEAEGYRLTIVHVISPDVGSAQSVGRWLDLTEEHADQIAVVNLKHGKPPADFPFWYGFVDAHGEKAMLEASNLANVPDASAGNSISTPPPDRSRARVFPPFFSPCASTNPYQNGKSAGGLPCLRLTTAI